MEPSGPVQACNGIALPLPLQGPKLPHLVWRIDIRTDVTHLLTRLRLLSYSENLPNFIETEGPFL